MRNKPRARNARVRRESPPEAKDERSESFAGGAGGFAKQNRVFEHTSLPLCSPGVSIKQIIIELNRNQGIWSIPINHNLSNEYLVLVSNDDVSNDIIVNPGTDLIASGEITRTSITYKAPSKYVKRLCFHFFTMRVLTHKSKAKPWQKATCIPE